MTNAKVLATQLDFYRRGRAGCKFTMLAAADPSRYGWVQRVVQAELREIEVQIGLAVEDADTTTLSLIFPSVVEPKDLVALIREVSCGRLIFAQESASFSEFRCIRLRVRVCAQLSWVSGFGPFQFLPATRQSPFTEITFRVKERPNYAWLLKTAPEGVVHLADMDMRGLPESVLRSMCSSFAATEGLLGAKPDTRSAAKTTFAIPKGLMPEEL